LRDQLVVDFGLDEHVARHGIYVEEVLEVFYSRHVRSSGHSGRFRIIGQTVSGRFLTLVVGKRGRGRLALVTARDADEAERRFFRRRLRR
jgi:hypothetical protein